MLNLLNLPKNAGVIGPFIGVVILLTTVLLLVVQMTIRPWATDDYGSETHLSMQEELNGYTRTELTYVDTVSAAPLGWEPSDIARASSEGYAEFVGYGCASCHGINGLGSASVPAALSWSAACIHVKFRGTHPVPTPGWAAGLLILLLRR